MDSTTPFMSLISEVSSDISELDNKSEKSDGELDIESEDSDNESGDSDNDSEETDIEFVCPPKTLFSTKYLFESVRDRDYWEKLPFKTESFLHNIKTDYYTVLLKQNKMAIYMAIFTTDSWRMMEEARLKRRDRGVFYGSSLPLKNIKSLRNIYTIDWNIETGRILGIGTIFDPTNTISSANTNGRSVRIYNPPYDGLNTYVYGGPRWTPRANFSPEMRPIIYEFEQLIHERPFLSCVKKDPNVRLFLTGGIKRLPLKYAIWLEHRLMRLNIRNIPLDVLCLRVIQETNSLK